MSHGLYRGFIVVFTLPALAFLLFQPFFTETFALDVFPLERPLGKEAEIPFHREENNKRVVNNRLKKRSYEQPQVVLLAVAVTRILNIIAEEAYHEQHELIERVEHEQ